MSRDDDTTQLPDAGLKVGMVDGKLRLHFATGARDVCLLSVRRFAELQNRMTQVPESARSLLPIHTVVNWGTTFEGSIQTLSVASGETPEAVEQWGSPKELNEAADSVLAYSWDRNQRPDVETNGPKA